MIGIFVISRDSGQGGRLRRPPLAAAEGGRLDEIFVMIRER
jgi:hypothetical protein